MNPEDLSFLDRCVDVIEQLVERLLAGAHEEKWLRDELDRYTLRLRALLERLPAPRPRPLSEPAVNLLAQLRAHLANDGEEAFISRTFALRGASNRLALRSLGVAVRERRRLMLSEIRRLRKWSSIPSFLGRYRRVLVSLMVLRTIPYQRKFRNVNRTVARHIDRIKNEFFDGEAVGPILVCRGGG